MPKRLQPDDRIAAIMVQARRVLSLRGHDGFLPSEVAERCRVSEATIYRYFPTKRDLLMRVAEAWFEEILSVEPKLATERDVPHRLRLVVAHSLEVLRREPSLTRYVLTESRIDPAYRRSRIYDLMRRFTSTVTKVIEAGIASGELRADLSPVLVREMVFGCIEQRAWSYLGGHRDFSVADTAEHIASLVLEGLGAAQVRDRRAIESVLERLDADVDALRAQLRPKRPRR